MLRRQPFDRVNPRNVMPSRHTIFIRGLPGPTDVTKVKEFFSAEASSKCSVDFFSTSDDKKRLSVAIRFKSHDVARDMLMKFNNKPLLGFPVEVTWFKDLKKARAKMFEEQRQGNRQFQRNGRGNFHSNDHRGGPVSPNSYMDNRRVRGGSSSSGGLTGGNQRRPKYSQSRSRSFTGSSSRSGSQSGRSGSASPHIRRIPQNPPDGMRGNMRGFSDGQPPSMNDRRIPRNQSYRSASGSSSSSRSSPGLRLPPGSANAQMPNQKVQSMRYQHGRGGASPLNYNQPRRDGQASGSPGASADYSSFANAPAPDLDGGSSLVSGLIQLKRRNQPEIQEPRMSRRNRRSSIGSSSSGLSGTSPLVNLDPSGVARSRAVGKRLPSLSPTFAGVAQRDYKVQKNVDPTLIDDDTTDFSKRKRSRQMVHSPGSFSPPPVKSSFIMDPSKLLKDVQDPLMKQRAPPDQPDTSCRRNAAHRSSRLENHPQSIDPSRWRSSLEANVGEDDGWTRSFNRTVERGRKSAKHVDESLEGQTSNSEIENNTVSEKRTRSNQHRKKETDLVDDVKDNAKEIATDGNQDTLLDLIRQRKDSLAQDYKRDCEAFTTVVRTLISRDIELENRLIPMLKEILHERGQRCIEELRSFISTHQPETDAKPESIEVPAV